MNNFLKTFFTLVQILIVFACCVRPARALGDVQSNEMPVPYEWEMRMPGLARVTGDRMVIDIHYQKTEPLSVRVEKAWKANVEILCPHGNRIRCDVFELNSVVGKSDSIAVVERVREVGKYKVIGRVYPVPEEEKKRSTGLGWIAREVRIYINNYAGLEWKVEAREATTPKNHNTCRYEVDGQVLSPNCVE